MNFDRLRLPATNVGTCFDKNKIWVQLVTSYCFDKNAFGALLKQAQEAG